VKYAVRRAPCVFFGHPSERSPDHLRPDFHTERFSHHKFFENTLQNIIRTNWLSRFLAQERCQVLATQLPHSQVWCTGPVRPSLVKSRPGQVNSSQVKVPHESFPVTNSQFHGTLPCARPAQLPGTRFSAKSMIWLWPSVCTRICADLDAVHRSP
jgi:hypothetical protein